MTETDMCNLALGMLGHDRTIAGDFRTATSTEAVRCRLHFDGARKRVLSAHSWIFAEDHVTLCAEPDPADASVTGWQAFALPSDCLNIVRAYEPECPGNALDFAPTADGVCCPRDRVTVAYVRDLKNLAAWPQPALDALAAELAARLSGAITGSAEKARAFRQDAARELAQAALWNARQAPQKPTGHNRYAESRNGRNPLTR